MSGADAAAGPSTSAATSRFAGKLCLVTAGTAGIGLATAARLGAEGGTVVICSRSQANVDAALAHLKACGLTDATGVAANVNTAAGLDATLAAVRAAAARLGRPADGRCLDVLISNAAANPVAGPALAAPDGAVSKTLDANVAAPLRLVRAAGPLLARGAAVVLVSSVTAFRPDSPPIAVYAVSKTALVALSRVLASELAPRGVRVNCVAPGTVATKFAAALVDDPAARAEAEGRTLLGRLGTPGEIAAAIAFLASSDASYVVGETLVVAGGMLASRL
jgi:dehydrogenase/reductase SDR family member 4